jgi:Lrp/AsnC family leucine-responsive transcriptional regulator
MDKFDLKDRKILYELDENSRQSLTQIGKKVGLKKDVVLYRIKRLEEKGVIRNYTTLFNILKLGLISVRFCYVFQYTTPEIKKEIIDYFVKSDLTTFIFSTDGKFDLEVNFTIRSPYDFFSFHETTIMKYGDYFAEREFIVNGSHLNLSHSFLLNEKKERKIANVFNLTKDNIFNIMDVIDDLDRDILKIMSINARIPTIQLAKKLNSTSRTINNRIKRLKDLGVITAFSCSIDYTKIGYNFYVVSIEFKKYSKIKKLIDDIAKNPNLFYIESIVGYGDYNFAFLVKDVYSLRQIMDDLIQRYPETIRKYNSHSYLKVHKNKPLPDII